MAPKAHPTDAYPTAAGGKAEEVINRLVGIRIVLLKGLSRFRISQRLLVGLLVA